MKPPLRSARNVIGDGISLLALVVFVFIVRALFMAQTQPSAANSTATPDAPTQFPSATFTVENQPPLPPAPSAILTLLPAGDLPTPPPQPTMFPSPTPISGRDLYWPQKITNTPTGAFRPSMSPDGKHLAYASERGGNWDIYSFDLNSVQEVRLTDDPLNDMSPAWSPDGSRIAYQHNLPAIDGPVKVDYMIMQPDGSNKQIVFSGANWNGNVNPAWSPAADKIAIADRGSVIVVKVNDRTEIKRFAGTTDRPYVSVEWLDDRRVLFIDGANVLAGNIETGSLDQIVGTGGNVQQALLLNTGIVYLWQNSGKFEVSAVNLAGTQSATLALIQSGSIEGLAVSPDGEFIAVQAGGSVHVIAVRPLAQLPQQPLFRIDQNIPPTDLLGVTWLPDSSGFVFALADNNQIDLYLARLNIQAITDLRNNPPIAVATSAPPTIRYTPDSKPISPVFVADLSFWPGPALPIKRGTGFGFGVAITATSSIPVIASAAAYEVRRNEIVPDCNDRTIPTDRSFWANQADFRPGQFHYTVDFPYSSTLPDADRLVVRINVVSTEAVSELLYCAMRVYPFTPSIATATPAS